MQTQIRRHIMWRLIWVYIVCQQDFPPKIERKRQNRPDTPKMTIVLVHHLTVGESTSLQWVKDSIHLSSGEPGLVDRVLALHAVSRGFDSHRGHISERFFRSNRRGYPHPVSAELENWRSVIAVSLNVGGGVRLIRPAKLCMCTQNTTNTTRTDARRRV